MSSFFRPEVAPLFQKPQNSWAAGQSQQREAAVRAVLLLHRHGEEEHRGAVGWNFAIPRGGYFTNGN
eukprot:2824195-Rhodomonas_salina.1